MNNNQENLNKKIEETKKVFKKMFGGSCSYHEEDSWGRKNGIFTIKLENPEKKNIKILTDFEKALGNGQPVNFKIENSEGKLIEVSKEEFAKWMGEGKNIKTPPKESLVYGGSADIDGTTYFTERKGKNGFFRESYYQPRNEEEKKQIIERNRKKREQEKPQIKNSPIQDKKVEKETDQQNQSQKLENKDNSSKNIYYGVGAIFLVLLAASMITVWVKKKRKLK